MLVYQRVYPCFGGFEWRLHSHPHFLPGWQDAEIRKMVSMEAAVDASRYLKNGDVQVFLVIQLIYVGIFRFLLVEMIIFHIFHDLSGWYSSEPDF